ncbi:S26 family signal peptidase [Planosporangium flavigriseum]|uniref:S26 family signal peptidase n=1 Tax=Planosporangium flavigriseum TaxID=373681 RepID=UPI00143B17E3|nr:S26 family signal peptidase [Planosporangium flavigriseum]NJC66699.1 S26 family signal peptidase [Planosporangium flavigriseum]
MPRLRLPWYRVLVRGPSMAPTLRDGDALLVRRTTRVRPGDVVVARFRSRPSLLVVKRVARAEGDGWWLVGDNEFVADDSRAYGIADIDGRVVLRWWPRLSLIRRR